MTLYGFNCVGLSAMTTFQIKIIFWLKEVDTDMEYGRIHNFTGCKVFISRKNVLFFRAVKKYFFQGFKIVF